MDNRDELEAELASRGWQLTFAGTSRGDPLFTAEKIFEGSPVRQSTASERGLLKAVEAYERHKAGDAVDPELARRLTSRISTGLSNTHNTRY